MLLTKIIGMFSLLVLLATVGLISVSAAVGQRIPSAEIAYVTYASANPDIYVSDIGRGYSHNLTHNAAYDAAPAWSPDGEWLAFQSNRDGRVLIYVMDKFGRNVRPLTTEPGTFVAPRWSRDGEYITFFANQNGALYSIRPDGTDLRQLTENGEFIIGQALDLDLEPLSLNNLRAPDGTRTMFMGYRERIWGIFVTAANDRTDANLLVSVGRAYTELPVWSPDSQRIAYVHFANGRYDIFAVEVHPDGSAGERRQVSFTRFIDTSPNWRPLRQ